MSVCGEVKVIPEALPATLAKLRATLTGENEDAG